jgi:hypothetical protein
MVSGETECVVEGGSTLSNIRIKSVALQVSSGSENDGK